MSGEKVAGTPVFAVCALADIERGGASAVSVAHRGADGEIRPLSLVLIRTRGNEVHGYINRCPHAGTWLNVGSGDFFSRDRAFLRCSRHGALFEIDSGACIEGPCRGTALEIVPVAIVDGDVCLFGIDLVDDTGPDPFNDPDPDETMEIMIQAD